MRKDSYVYCHRRKDNGKVFYIGVGSDFKNNKIKQRAFTRSGRSDDWKRLVDEAGGFDCSVLVSDITKQDSHEMESLLISMYPENKLVNKTKDNSINNITYEKFSDILYYSSDSKTGLKWKVDRNSITKKDMDAGYKHGNYFRVEVDHRAYMAHRIVWCMCKQDNDIEEYVINHIDCNGSNNKIENLEKCTSHENNTRQSAHVYGKVRKNNKIGVTGVSLNRSGSGYECLSVNWTEDGIRKLKIFSIVKHGYEEALRLATEYRKQMEELHYNK